MPRYRTAVLIALLLTGSALAASTAAGVGFSTPSRNISCVLEPAGHGRSHLRCDVSRTAHVPERPRSCHFDWGHAFGMYPASRARRLCVSDAVNRAGVLRYGKTFRRAGFICTSRRSGLVCRNRSGHGFRLSREHQVIF